MADNSSRKFKFISPGVFIKEIDNSELPAVPAEVGPLLIGRARKGPANKPVQITSYSDFVQTFGNPSAGNEGGDVWRVGDFNAPTYAPFAAKAWLASSNPITYIRALGDESEGYTATTGRAGWKLDPTEGTSLAQGGAYGLLIFPSGSGTQNLTGTLAAQFYCQDSRVILSGNVRGTDNGGSFGSTLIDLGTNLDSIPLVFTGSDMNYKEFVSFNESKPNYIRRVLNTDPTVTNSTITNSETQTFYQGGKYFLGETYENRIGEGTSTSLGLLNVGGGVSKYYGAIVPMMTKTAATTFTNDQANFLGAARKASTGWFFSQDLGSNPAAYAHKNMQRLFRIEALTAGENFNRDVKISIANIKAGRGDFQPYGSFSLLVRSLNDTDNNQVILERYDNLNLNPASPNYIAARIGDKYQVYSQAEKRSTEYGEFENRSNYIRVVMDPDIAAGIGETRLLPFGVFGPPKYRDVTITSGSTGLQNLASIPDGDPVTAAGPLSALTMIAPGASASFGADGHDIQDKGTYVAAPLLMRYADDRARGDVLTTKFTGSIKFPAPVCRASSLQGSPRSLDNTFWGVWTGKAWNNAQYNHEMSDYLRPRNFDASSESSVYDPTQDVDGETTNSGSSPLVLSYAFSLDDVAGTLNGTVLSGAATWASGNRAGSTSISANYSYTGTLDAGIDRFTTVLAGGSDGYNKTERDPFANKDMDGKTEQTSYGLFSLRKAVNMASDPEVVQMNAISIPGVWAPGVTNYVLDTAESRGDALAVVDLQYGWTPQAETNDDPVTANAGNTPKAAADALANRSINNSYGAAYYPWVRIYDDNSDRSLWAPPSVAALGVLSNTDRLRAPWFAPAGFTRGGLSEGAAGIPVTDVTRRLTSDDRDLLYDNNINPIAKFPAEGIVVFGQKTLQQTASALDRINVRRLMIYLKREISFIASRLLFGPNTSVTWDTFKGQALPILRDVKTDFGIEDFKLILDESTTTPDLVDRNIIYAKLLVKPTRAVEYFAIDFVVTNSGASFED